MGAIGPVGDETVGLHEERTIAARVLLAAFAVVLASSVVARAIGWLSEQIGSDPSVCRRLTAIVRDLPAMAAKDEKAVLAIGDSLTELGFLPTVFDQEMRKANLELGKPSWPVVSYNLGLAALPPAGYHAFLHKVVKAYQAAGKRPAAIVIEIYPPIMTQADYPPMLREVRLNVDDLSETLALVRSSPDEGLRELGRRYLMGHRSGPHITFRFKRAIEDIPYWIGDETSADAMERQGKFANSLLDFNLNKRGEPNVPADTWRAWLERTREVRAQEVMDVDWEDSYREDAVVQMIEVVKKARSAADEVFLVIPPHNPCGAPRPPGFEEEGFQVVARIQREGGARAVINLSGLLPCEDFIDGVHPDLLTGSPKVTRAIARNIAAAR